MTHNVLRMTVATVVGLSIFSSPLKAADGVAKVGQVQTPIYVPVQAHHGAWGHNQIGNCWGYGHRQPPNPTYWTWMPCPFHGCCDYCADPGCPGQKGMWTFPAVRWLLDPDYYTVAPDYGFSPPARVPVRRQNVTYTNYYPDQWYGTHKAGHAKATPRRPIIATPTDTTQLGYYYQQVPTWQSRDILPVPPHPRHWHTRPCTPDQCQSYVRWMPIRKAWVPLCQIPHVKPADAPAQQNNDPAPVPQEPVPPQPPANDAAPVPVIPMRPMNAPEALNIPEVSEQIRRVSNN